MRASCSAGTDRDKPRESLARLTLEIWLSKRARAELCRWRLMIWSLSLAVESLRGFFYRSCSRAQKAGTHRQSSRNRPAPGLLVFSGHESSHLGRHSSRRPGRHPWRKPHRTGPRISSLPYTCYSCEVTQTILSARVIGQAGSPAPRRYAPETLEMRTFIRDNRNPKEQTMKQA